MPPIYLDHNATTPIAPEVGEAMLPYLHQHFGNPSSTHWYGVAAKKAVEKARTQVAALLGCEPDEIIFTSGGSESNNYAIKGTALTFRHKGNHIITSQVEHPAVVNVCKFLEKEYHFEITYLPVDRWGEVQLTDLETALRPGTLLITIMHANNEVGTIQPIEEISRIARKHNIFFHTDAAQSAGKIPAKVTELGVDMLSLAGHKLYAPKGIGALYLRRGIKLNPLIHGADHEAGRRAGTENVLEIVGLGAACELAKNSLAETMSQQKELRDQLWNGLKDQIPGLLLNGHPEKRLPNTLSVSFPGIDANTLLSELETVAASAGAACHSDVFEPSAVLKAMQLSDEQAISTVRFTTGRLNNTAQIDQAITAVEKVVASLQPQITSRGFTTAFADVKLTHFTHGLGCACKLRPQNLEKILASLPPIVDPAVLVGISNSDDAGVYQLSEDLALVQTVDFFTPIVDNPYDFGAIAAANSLSDIYAMGAVPLFALNIVGFPEKRLPMEVLKEILRGASDKASEAGISIIGGHSVEDSEPKFGLAVTGKIHPKKILMNAGAQPGDVLILTKPIGTGILTTGLKQGLLEKAVSDKVVQIMSTLNRTAAEVIQTFTIHACTDVTGFGLLGHLKEMLVASKVNARLSVNAIPMIPEALELARANVVPGGTLANLEYTAKYVTWDDTISSSEKNVIADAQTSGGLLLSVPANEVARLQTSLLERGVFVAAAIGVITTFGEGKIQIER
jgi:cysteine desulfurase NifS/selenium donor protein